MRLILVLILTLLGIWAKTGTSPMDFYNHAVARAEAKYEQQRLEQQVRDDNMRVGHNCACNTGEYGRLDSASPGGAP